jgi:hypothetical protein
MALNFANNNSLSAITTLPASISGGGMTLISEQTASASATIDFTSGIDDTYDSYVFKFIDIHPANNNVTFSFQVDTGTNTNYNITCTSSFFRASHGESGSGALQYRANDDQAQGTAFNKLIQTVGADNDQSGVGYLQIFSPSSNTFVKHWIANTNGCHEGDITRNVYTAGYFNTATPITRARFKFDSGNIDSGVIKLYGIS